HQMVGRCVTVHVTRTATKNFLASAIYTLWPPISPSMDAVAAFLKLALRPASISFVVIALGIGVVLSWSRRLWRLAPFYWLLLFVVYAGMAPPIVAGWLVGPARTCPPPPPPPPHAAGPAPAVRARLA